MIDRHYEMTLRNDMIDRHDMVVIKETVTREHLGVYSYLYHLYTIRNSIDINGD